MVIYYRKIGLGVSTGVVVILVLVCIVCCLLRRPNQTRHPGLEMGLHLNEDDDNIPTAAAAMLSQNETETPYM